MDYIPMSHTQSRKRRTAETVLEEFRAEHGNDYTYDMSGYKTLESKIPTKCKIADHPTFYPTAKNHKNGSGCMKCYNQRTSSRQKGVSRKGIGGAPKKSPIQFFIEMAELHDIEYDYTNTVFTTMREFISFECPNPSHETISMRASAHAHGQGCKHCKLDAKRKPKEMRPDGWVGKTTKWTTERFVTYCTYVHNGRYTYPNSVYINNMTDIEIECSEHGSVWVKPKVHKKGHDCKLCTNDDAAIRMRNTTEQILNKCREVHGDEYAYRFSGTETSGDKFMAWCQDPEHPWFPVTSVNHLVNQSGCPACASGSSKAQIAIYDYVKSMCPDAQMDDRKIIAPKELDIVVPSLKIAIEYNGLYWHSQISGKKTPKYHSDKVDACNMADYRLITIFENEWLETPEIVKARLKYILGFGDAGIGARKTTISPISFKEAKDFLNRYHIQGSTTQMPVRFGAFAGGSMLAVMCFSKPRVFMGGKSEGNPELVRFATDGRNHSGIASKLFTHFLREHQPNGVISYSDRRWSDGNLYEMLGFGHSHTSKPNYSYAKNKELFHRFKFQKKKLLAMYDDVDNSMTEWEIMQSKGYDRIYDCGSDVWVYDKSS